MLQFLYWHVMYQFQNSPSNLSYFTGEFYAMVSLTALLAMLMLSIELSKYIIISCV